MAKVDKISSIQKKEIFLNAQEQARLAGHRWTVVRSQVLQTMLDLDRPLTAYQLLQEVAQRYNRTVQPPSIYRSLDALMMLGIVAKIGNANRFIVCKPAKKSGQQIVLVCDHCGSIDEINDQGLSSRLLKDIELSGFKTARQVLELHGDCSGCQKQSE